MNGINAWQSALTTSWIQVWSTILGVLPVVLGAVLVFVVGLFMAFWVKRLTVRILDLANFEKFSKASGINEYLKKADIKLSLTQVLGTAAEWTVILIFFLAVVDILGLTAVSRVLTQVLNFLPNVLAAALILGAGYMIAGVVDSVVRGALVSIDKDIAKPIGRLSRWLVLLVAVFAAIDQLQIAQGLIQTFFQGLTFTLVLVIGLSVGLGSKDLVSKVLDDWYKKISKK